MTTEQEQTLTEKMTQLGYPDLVIMPGQEQVLMLYVHDHLICGALYALSMSDEQLKALLNETVGIAA